MDILIFVDVDMTRVC